MGVKHRQGNWQAMKFKIWKFPFQNIGYHITLDMPEGARPLCVQIQDNMPCVWALVDPGNPKRPRRFRLAGTGHPIEPEDVGRYVGTFQMQNGELVFHLFDLEPVMEAIVAEMLPKEELRRLKKLMRSLKRLSPVGLRFLADRIERDLVP